MSAIINRNLLFVFAKVEMHCAAVSHLEIFASKVLGMPTSTVRQPEWLHNTHITNSYAKVVMHCTFLHHLIVFASNLLFYHLKVCIHQQFLNPNGYIYRK